MAHKTVHAAEERGARDSGNDFESMAGERTKELQNTTNRLENELEKRRLAEQSLKESEEKYVKAFMACPEPMAIGRLEDGKIVEANQAFLDVAGYSSKEEVIGKTTIELGLWKDPSLRKGIAADLKKHGRVRNREFISMWHGKEHVTLYSAEVIQLGGEDYVVAMVKDVTELRQAVKALRERDEELEVKSRQLVEVNEALRMLLGQSKEEARLIEHRIVSNVEDLVLPYIRRMKETRLGVDQQVYLNVIEANLKELLAPFMRQIGTKHPNLTPREIEVANLVRMGTTSKEIAKLLKISKRAVEFHRDSLRKKLGLKNSKRNLRAYLASLA